ncbi:MULTISPECIES: helix-turn-helix transcriptional regulator [Acinetobacter]|uniref:helix-turn-helix transcriptional regulator n=1 Tax=Acinetobacter TaxID=469 RepID=UPI001021B0FE|nr:MULTISPECIES: helix-turn-helix transcriptional regulator [Acinetobacter]MDM1762140.1 helix-turn-helix transcriptional regulator [Acinetobacter sp. 251-1]RYL29690.1 LuxR family transcriptional regulator [Acinetobacter piscicola]
MLNHQFITDFTQNFIQQVSRVFDFDGYLLYSIDNIHHAYNYQNFNIPAQSLTEYLNREVENDPVSFMKHYQHKDHNVELLSEYTCDDHYADFMQRWKLKDTAEIFFRKRNGEPILGLSIIREKNSQIFTVQEKNMLDAFCELSKKYFFNQTDQLENSAIYDVYHFTKKEIVVLELILRGLNNQSVAQYLNCSLATVKTHVQHIYQKTGINNRQEIMLKFLK